MVHVVGCVVKNLRAEAHGTGRGREILLYHDIHVVGGEPVKEPIPRPRPLWEGQCRWGDG